LLLADIHLVEAKLAELPDLLLELADPILQVWLAEAGARPSCLLRYFRLLRLCCWRLL